jgi:dipeptidase E
MTFSRSFTEHSADVIGEWYLKPHLYSPDFPERDDAWADRIVERADFPIYFIDDETAVRVRGDKVAVVSEGRWRFHR